MHELSVVMGIIDIAAKEAAKAGAGAIEEIELEIGCLSGVEPAAFDFAWQQAVKHTLLENAKCTVSRPQGKALCLQCNTEFSIQQVYDACPACGQHWISVIQGKELRVRSLVIS